MAKREKDPKNVRKGRLSRRKGKVWEREVARSLRPIFGDSVHRGHQDARGGSGAGEGSDIEGTPFYMECRHEATYDWRRHFRETQAKRAERGDDRPMVLVAKDGKKPPGWKPGTPGTPPIAIMLWEDLLKLLEIVHDRKDSNSG